MNSAQSKQDLKTLLKPLIREAVRDFILESGVLSNLISEVVSGLKSNLVVESSSHSIDPLNKRTINERRKELEEERQIAAQKIAKATGIPTHILPKLNETQPEEKVLLEEKKKAATEDRANAEFGAPAGGYALRNIDPGDPGINISGILNVAGGKQTWMRQLNHKKGKKNEE